MTRFAAIAAILLATTAAKAADTYSFDLGGQTVTIDAPKDCNSAECVSISIPGVFEYNTKRIRRDRDNRESNTAPAPREERVRPAPPPTTAQPAPPAPVAAAPAAPSNTTTAPAASSAAQPGNLPAATEPAPSTVVANAPASDPAVKPTPAPAAAASPLGIWMTEKNEGKIRIENCGSDICGYAMDKKTEANGEKILINMKPGDSKWAGKIYDPKSGSTYDSTIALKGNDSLRVQGCAFGGMFCGGQTWTRVN